MAVSLLWGVADLIHLAVAMAAALNADRCDIYTDVDGVYTTDPRIAPKARKLSQITFEEMLEMASSGAKVCKPDRSLWRCGMMLI